MNDKFTLRDFLCYFLVGLYLLITLLFVFKHSLLDFFGLDVPKIKDYSALYIFLLLPSLYLTGHLIQGIDYPMYRVGNWLEKKSWLPNWSKYIFLNPLLKHRVTARLKNANIGEGEFWKDCTYLIINSSYEKAEYWSLMKTLFEGLTLISAGWVIYFIINPSKINIFVAVVITIIFWIRTRQMADNFIKTVKDIKEALTISNRAS